MNSILETERLLLRKFSLDDTKFILELLNSPGWIEFIGDRNVKTEGDAINYLQNGPIKSYELHGFGLSMVELKQGKIPIGMCGILKRDGLDNPEIGFAFLPQYTGNGYAFEIAGATMAFAIDSLKIKTIHAITLPKNRNSIKLLHKIGMKFIKPIFLPNDLDELMLYSN